MTGQCWGQDQKGQEDRGLTIRDAQNRRPGVLTGLGGEARVCVAKDPGEATAERGKSARS